MIPRPSNPLVVALDVSEPRRGRAAGARSRAARGHAQGRPRARVGATVPTRSGVSRRTRRSSSTRSCTTSRTRSSAPPRNIARLGVAMLNVHALGGEAMMRAAVEGAARGADEGGHASRCVVAVTVLSSMAGEELASPTSLAFEAQSAGLDGVRGVGRGRAAMSARSCGEEFCLVVPGIRPAGAERRRSGAGPDSVGGARSAAPTTSSSGGRSRRPRSGGRRERHRAERPLRRRARRLVRSRVGARVA